MATARQLHNVPATVDITIPASGTIPDSEGFLWAADGTNVQWTNNMTEEVQIVFTTSEFSSIAILPGNTSTAISASATAINYQLENGSGSPINNNEVPYAIQWGQDGVMEVSVTANSIEFTVSVPASESLDETGNIQFTADAEYKVQWTNSAGNPVTAWSPQPSIIYPTPPGGVNPNPVQEAVPGAPSPVYCTFASANNVPGKITVHIGS
jgi:hypothetical protein